MRLFISAAEASGDRLAADLVQTLRQRHEGLEVRGLAGPALRAQGVEAVALAEEVSVMGIAEVLAQLPRLLGVRRRVRRALAEGADLLVVVDAPDFNLPLARLARSLAIPVVFYVSPQVWAWRRRRAGRIAALAEDVLCLLPFEPPHYHRHGGTATFVGHPVAGRLAPSAERGSHWAVLPGSRRSELARHLPVFRAAVAALRRRLPDAEVRLPLAPGLSPADLGELDDIDVVQDLQEAVTGARACLVASGTATLEVACLGVPMIVAWRGHPLTYWIGRALVRHISWIALPNLVAGRAVVPEFIQHLDPEVLAEAWIAAADSDQRQALAGVRGVLAGEDAVARAADRVGAVLRR